MDIIARENEGPVTCGMHQMPQELVDRILCLLACQSCQILLARFPRQASNRVENASELHKTC